MDNSSDQAGVTSSFAETVLSVEEAELAVDEEVAESSLFSNPPMSPGFNFGEGDGEECVRRTLEQLSSEARVGCHADCVTERDTEEDETSFVDVMGVMDVEDGGVVRKNFGGCRRYIRSISV